MKGGESKIRMLPILYSQFSINYYGWKFDYYNEYYCISSIDFVAGCCIVGCKIKIDTFRQCTDNGE